MPPAAFYEPDGRAWVPTELTRGPWDPDAQHAGPPAALLGRAVEQAARPGLRVARATFEILRPVPIAPLEVATRLVRGGRSVEVHEAALTAGGVEVVLARFLRLRESPTPLPAVPAAGAPVPGPDQGRSQLFSPAHGLPGYHTAMEWRFVKGAFREPGPAAAWLRMRHPLVPGEEPSPLCRVLIAADSGNGVSAALDPSRYLFVNADLTVHLQRLPAGEWVCLDARTSIDPAGVGLAAATLHDRSGPIGYGLQSLFVAER